ncbi:6-phospho-beta-glucosidase [Brachybacterium muris]|uniref:family 4 glycosyl hydrolase n=1 Tax=Brachybacterium muris TaxID=219301 RepID=UPI00195E3F0E|nr:6-phospho-beta-glucosidase [Brachybacterium muris]MBM7500296.1 6-phospho-beta-glucosidase [Brachybacterium muris]MCT1430923.1 6-phospho-beta-glucosidase [Brachybacterium muris]
MKLALLGGGGFRVPLVFRTLLADTSPGRVTELRLVDTDPARLRTMSSILETMSAGRADAPRILLFTDLREAVRGVDFVFSALRVGGTRGRALDEQIAQQVGLLGQETTGFGGISYALRGLPTALDIARTIAEVNPEAWLINFTNPAGIVTEASRAILGDRVIGICDSPIGLARRALGALESAGLAPAGTTAATGLGDSPVRLDYIGLNHLGWLQGLEVDGTDLMPALLARPDLLERTEEGRLFGADWVRTLGCLPNEYLHYYYFARETVAADADADLTRGRFLLGQQDAFFTEAAGSPERAAELWEATRRRREETYMATNREAAGGMERDEADLESGGYDKVALAIMHAIAHDRPAQLILNVANGSQVDFLPPDAVIEVPCTVDANGATAHQVSPVPVHGRGLVHTVKTVERTVIAAVQERSRDLAVEALALHPLIDGVGVARKALALAEDAFPELAYLR